MNHYHKPIVQCNKRAKKAMKATAPHKTHRKKCFLFNWGGSTTVVDPSHLEWGVKFSWTQVGQGYFSGMKNYPVICRDLLYMSPSISAWIR